MATNNGLQIDRGVATAAVENLTGSQRAAEPPKPLSLKIDDSQRDAHGRVYRARNGARLSAYNPDQDPSTEGIQEWKGDWNLVDYGEPSVDGGLQPFGADGAIDWTDMANYAAQRILDFTAPGNDTLTMTQKAILWEAVHRVHGGATSFAESIGRYLDTGDAFAYGGLPDDHVRDQIKDVLKTLGDLEKQANLPNAEMRQASAFMESIRDKVDEQLDDPEESKRMSDASRAFRFITG